MFRVGLRLQVVGQAGVLPPDPGQPDLPCEGRAAHDREGARLAYQLQTEVVLACMAATDCVCAPRPGGSGSSVHPHAAHPPGPAAKGCCSAVEPAATAAGAAHAHDCLHLRGQQQQAPLPGTADMGAAAQALQPGLHARVLCNRGHPVSWLPHLLLTSTQFIMRLQDGMVRHGALPASGVQHAAHQLPHELGAGDSTRSECTPPS